MDNGIIALYVRVSTDMQVDRGESISVQKTRLIEFAKEKNLTPQIYEDPAKSAKDLNRPALQRLFDDIKNHKIQMVAVTKLDRITRSGKNLYELLELFEDYRVSFKSLGEPIDTSTVMGKGFVSILGVIAEIERGITSERVRESMRYRAKAGKWNGGVNPYGYTSFALEVKKCLKSGVPKEEAESKAIKITPEQKKLYINPTEARVVETIFKQYLKLESLRGVTQWLNSNGYRTRKGKTWAAPSISRILSNPTYIGNIWYNKRVSAKTTTKLKKRPEKEWIIEKGLHKPIIDNATFEKVQEILKRQSVEPRRKMSEYLLSGLVRCGKCGGRMSGYTQRRITPKSPRLYSYYKCHNCQSKGKSVCTGMAIPKSLLEDIVAEKITSLANNKRSVVDMKKTLEAFNREIIDEIGPMKKDRDRLISSNKGIDEKKKNLLIHLEEGIVSKDAYKDRVFTLEEEQKRNQTRILEIENKLGHDAVESIDFSTVYETIKNFSLNWKDYDTLSRKELLWSIISQIVVKEGDIKIDLYFLPSFFSKLDNTRAGVHGAHEHEFGRVRQCIGDPRYSNLSIFHGLP